MNADCNLLFGILALQMDFIERDELIAAMNSWVLDKTKPLGEILEAQGKLSSERRQLLDALVSEHVKQHGNDPEKSLAALSSVGSVRADLERIADLDVDASMVHMSSARDIDVLATSTVSAGTRSSSGLRFTILRPHAKGGLGQVSVALDEELNREVAFKEIQDSHADDAVSRSRFLLEAEVTGGLEHPGIVPVYGLGKYGNGRPFYAMRFVKGDSLQAAIKRFHEADQSKRDPGQRSLELRKLLGRLIDVCNAIEYAHSRRVLHRDLKPGNIMLGKYGETLVVDWGLAKPLGHRESSSETDEPTLRPASASGPGYTQMGSAIGTPQYMSPEQAAGRIDELGPATDVYSLGATLYCLLTGQPPFPDSDVLETAARVCKGDFAPPRRVNPDVAAALQAICLKAMALKPTDRYASPRAMADDIERWLNDQPVSVHRDPFSRQFARWVRIHKGTAGAAAAAVAVLVVGALLHRPSRSVPTSGRKTLPAPAGWSSNSPAPIHSRCPRSSSRSARMRNGPNRSLREDWPRRRMAQLKSCTCRWPSSRVMRARSNTCTNNSCRVTYRTLGSFGTISRPTKSAFKVTFGSCCTTGPTRPHADSARGWLWRATPPTLRN